MNILKRVKKYLFVIISICTLLLSGCFKSYKAGVYVSDSGIDYISCNNRYKGELDYLGEESTVIIYDKKTKKSKSFKRESIYNHIVLGDDYFFLYNEPVSNGEKTKIARYTYDGKEIKVLELEDAAEVSCRNGILFIGCWREKSDGIWLADSYMKGFCANYYIEEKKFGEKFKWLDTKKKTVEVNGVTLYYHDRGYFCTEPDIGDYEGKVFWEALGDITLWPSLVYEHVDMLKQKFHFTEESKLAIYEYQDGYNIYGCCNLMDELTNPLPLTDHDVNRSWCYRINGKTKEMEVLEEREKTLAMYCTEKNTVYYKDKVVYCEERKTGKRKEITKRKQLRMSVSFDHGHIWCEDDTYVRID